MIGNRSGCWIRNRKPEGGVCGGMTPQTAAVTGSQSKPPRSHNLVSGLLTSLQMDQSSMEMVCAASTPFFNISSSILRSRSYCACSSCWNGKVGEKKRRDPAVCYRASGAAQTRIQIPDYGKAWQFSLIQSGPAQHQMTPTPTPRG